MRKTTGELEYALSCCTSLDRYLTENSDRVLREQVLADVINDLMEKKQLRRTEVIQKSGLNDIYVHQIISGKRHPSRNKLLCLFFGMELDVATVQQVLKRCGYPPLYAGNIRDSIILFALQHQYSLLQANEVLFEHGEPMLS